MSFLVPRSSAGSFINTTGRLASPRTEAQKRAASQTGDNKTVVCYALVTVQVPPGLVQVDPSTGNLISIPSNSGRGFILYNGGDKLPEDVVVIQNHTGFEFRPSPSVIIVERRDNAYFAVSGLTAVQGLLQFGFAVSGTGSVTHNVLPGQILRVSVQGDTTDVTITLDGDDWENIPFAPEFGVMIDSTNNNQIPITIIPANLSTASPAWSYHDKTGRYFSVLGDPPITLRGQGEYVRLKLMGSNPDFESAVWLVADDELRSHACELERAAAQSISSGVFTTIAFDATVIDDGALADVASNRIVIQRAGKYQVSLITGLDNPAGQTLNANGAVVVNGGLVRNTSMLPTSQNLDFVFAGSWIIELAAGDLITAQIRHNSTAAASQNLATAVISRCRLSVTEIR